MNGGVWKGCRWTEAERYRQKSWLKCWSTGLKFCSQSLSELVTSEVCAKEAVHDHTYGISWLTLLQNFVLFETCPEWIEVSHRGGSYSSQRKKAERRVLVASTVRRWRMLLMRLSSAQADLHMFVTCLSMVVLDEIVIPRFLAWVTNEMSELPTRIEVGAE